MRDGTGDELRVDLDHLRRHFRDQFVKGRMDKSLDLVLVCIVKFFAVLQIQLPGRSRLLRKNREMPFVLLATFFIFDDCMIVLKYRILKAIP